MLKPTSTILWRRLSGLNHKRINHDIWVCVIILSKKSCVMTSYYNFWPSDKCSILKIGIRVIPNFMPIKCSAVVNISHGNKNILFWGILRLNFCRPIFPNSHIFVDFFLSFVILSIKIHKILYLLQRKQIVNKTPKWHFLLMYFFLSLSFMKDTKILR